VSCWFRTSQPPTISREDRHDLQDEGTGDLPHEETEESLARLEEASRQCVRALTREGIAPRALEHRPMASELLEPSDDLVLDV
jgi:hypothetical protein